MLIIPVRDLAAGQASLDLDWQHASPTGGFVTSDFYPRDRVEVGHVVQVRGRWAVVQDIQRNLRNGYVAEVVHLVTYHGCLCLYSGHGATVRTDYRVARWSDIRRARAFAARWIAETERLDAAVEQTLDGWRVTVRDVDSGRLEDRRRFADEGPARAWAESRTSWQPTDANLAQVFAGCVKPLARELYPLLREQLADRSWLEAGPPVVLVPDMEDDEDGEEVIA